jgi:hypothetical protein
MCDQLSIYQAHKGEAGLTRSNPCLYRGGWRVLPEGSVRVTVELRLVLRVGPRRDRSMFSAYQRETFAVVHNK